MSFSWIWVVETNPSNRIYDLFFYTLISILLIILPIAVALLARPVTIIDKQKTGSIENNLDNP